MAFSLLVSKTTKELILSWDTDKSHEDAVSVAQDLRMPQFVMQNITTNRCHETNHMGKKQMPKNKLVYYICRILFVLSKSENEHYLCVLIYRKL